LSDLGNNFTREVVRLNILPEFLRFALIKLTILVGIIVVKDPLGILLQFEFGLAGLIRLIYVSGVSSSIVIVNRFGCRRYNGEWAFFNYS